MDSVQPLWQHYFDVIHESGLTSEPWGRERGRVEALLAELYRLGERPTRDEVAAYLDSRYGPSASLRRRTILKLWAKRLGRPHATWRTKDARAGYPWHYPFVFAHKYAKAHGADSVAVRLARQVAYAAHAYAAAVDHAPGTDEAEAAHDELRAATHALTVWGAVLDRADEGGWDGAGILPPRKTRQETMNHLTRRGRALYDAWIARLKAERDERESDDE